MILSNKSNLTKNLNKSNRIKASIMGFVVGDALGVPVEFQSRNILKRKKVKDMEEYGTHNQPKGTWSDDTSMVLATMDAIVNTPIDDMNTYTMFKNILDAFLNWKINSKYTPFNNVFDIGNSTNYSLTKCYSFQTETRKEFLELYDLFYPKDEMEKQKQKRKIQ